MKNAQIWPIALAVTLMAAPQAPREGTADESWTIEGRVLLGNQPVPGASVFSAKLAAVNTDENGHYVLIGTSPGNYIIYARKDHTGTSQSRSINVLAGSKATSMDFSLDKDGTISGKVLDSDGNPLPGVEVVALVRTFRNGSVRLEPKGHTATSNDGEYELNDLAESRYYLLASQTSAAQGLKPHPRTNPKTRGILVATAVNAFYPNADSFDGAVPLKLSTGEQRGGVNIILNRVPTGCVFATVAESPEVRRMVSARSSLQSIKRWAIQIRPSPWAKFR